MDDISGDAIGTRTQQLDKEKQQIEPEIVEETQKAPEEAYGNQLLGMAMQNIFRPEENKK